VLAQNIPWLLGGSADLGPSNKTTLTYEGAGDFQADSLGGKNLHCTLENAQPWPRMKARARRSSMTARAMKSRWTRWRGSRFSGYNAWRPPTHQKCASHLHRDWEVFQSKNRKQPSCAGVTAGSLEQPRCCRPLHSALARYHDTRGLSRPQFGPPGICGENDR
jgi:hypothetical protein